MGRFRQAGRRAALLIAVLAVAGCEVLSYLPGTPRPSMCDPSNTVVDDGHTASFGTYYKVAKGPLGQQDCQMVVSYLNAARDYVGQFPTVADAKAAGWVQATVWAPGQGIHFVDPDRINGPFDPQRPNWLVYNGSANTARLAGMMFVVQTSGPPPAYGFPGANDHWHNHDELCVKANATPFIIGEHLSDSYCAAIGGVNTDYTNVWMVHAWLPPYAGWEATDIFNVSHPALT